MSKDEIADKLDKYAEFLRLDEQSGRAHAYEKAGRSVRMASFIPPNPSRLDNIGDSTREAVIELENGIGIDELNELEEKYSWYDELRQVSHIGPSRAKTLHEEYGMDSLEDLELMARAGDLQVIQGVGPKTAAEMKESIEKLK